MRACPPAHKSPTSSTVNACGLGMWYQSCELIMNEMTAAQMLEDLVGSYRFKHALTVPGLADDAALIMHPSEVFNWLTWASQTTMVSRNFTCLRLHVSSHREWSRAPMAIHHPKRHSVSNVRDNLRRLCAHIRLCDAGRLDRRRRMYHHPISPFCPHCGGSAGQGSSCARAPD